MPFTQIYAVYAKPRKSVVFGASRNQQVGVEERAGQSFPGPDPWIPAFAGMTRPNDGSGLLLPIS